jgi:chromosome segregation ATPase
MAVFITAVLLVVLSTTTAFGTVDDVEPLDLMTRFGRQLKDDPNSGGGGGGGITLGLVGALQKWANTLEAQSAAILAEVGELKAAKARLTAEVTEVKLQNINLVNDIAAANERSLNLKDAYMRTSEEVAAVKAEAAALRQQLTAQQAATEQLASDQAVQLSGLAAELAALTGKQDTFKTESAAALAATAAALQANVTSTLHDLSHGMERSKEETETALAAFGGQLEERGAEIEAIKAEMGTATEGLEARLAALDGQVKRELTGSLQASVGSLTEARVYQLRYSSLRCLIKKYICYS